MEQYEIKSKNGDKKLVFTTKLWFLTEDLEYADSIRRYIQILERKVRHTIKEEYGYDYDLILDQDKIEPFPLNWDPVVETVELNGIKVTYVNHYVFVYAISPIADRGSVRWIRTRVKELNAQFVNNNRANDCFQTGSVIIFEDSLGSHWQTVDIEGLGFDVANYFGIPDANCMVELSLGAIGLEGGNQLRYAANPILSQVMPITLNVARPALDPTDRMLLPVNPNGLIHNNQPAEYELNIRLEPTLRKEVVAAHSATRMFYCQRCSYGYESMCQLASNSAGTFDRKLYYVETNAKAWKAEVPEPFSKHEHAVNKARDGFTGVMTANNLPNQVGPQVTPQQVLQNRRQMAYNIAVGADYNPYHGDWNLINRDRLRVTSQYDDIATDVYFRSRSMEHRLNHESMIGSVINFNGIVRQLHFALPIDWGNQGHHEVIIQGHMYFNLQDADDGTLRLHANIVIRATYDIVATGNAQEFRCNNLVLEYVDDHNQQDYSFIRGLLYNNYDNGAYEEYQYDHDSIVAQALRNLHIPDAFRGANGIIEECRHCTEVLAPITLGPESNNVLIGDIYTNLAEVNVVDRSLTFDNKTLINACRPDPSTDDDVNPR